MITTFQFGSAVSFVPGQETVIERHGVRSYVRILSMKKGEGRLLVRGTKKYPKPGSRRVPVTEVTVQVFKQVIL